jgi:hypothetical protein
MNTDFYFFDSDGIPTNLNNFLEKIFAEFFQKYSNWTTLNPGNLSAPRLSLYDIPGNNTNNLIIISKLHRFSIVRKIGYIHELLLLTNRVNGLEKMFYRIVFLWLIRFTREPLLKGKAQYN